MSFRKLEVYGFKSFADKLTVEFGDGVTGIVGPNGCGKSNVADAVRWVLGEQSVKILRGKSMQDVIFSGTEKRRSLSFCEVSLIFDNKDRTFNIDRDDVVISRKLYRSGESEYSLNRMPARLYEITNILRDTGIGKEGYCIIGQGRIDALLSAKPDDRRGIFEEAAGISKFKSEKVTAERTLERTRDNIDKINAVISEIGKQLGPLAAQAADARKFLTLSEQLKYNEINSYLYQYENASQSKRTLSTKLRAIEYDKFKKFVSFYEWCKSTNRYAIIAAKTICENPVILNQTIQFEDLYKEIIERYKTYHPNCMLTSKSKQQPEYGGYTYYKGPADRFEEKYGKELENTKRMVDESIELFVKQLE